MAVTFLKQPQLYTPSDNPVVWTFSSDQYAQANFQFLVEVYVNTVLRSRHLVFPEVNSDTAHFDAEAEKISNVVCSAPQTVLNDFDSDAGNHATINIKVFEQYGTPPVNQASATSSTNNIFKASLSDEDFVNWDFEDYAFNVNNSLWMTYFPRANYMLCEETKEHLFLMSLLDSVAALSVDINLYDASGGLIMNHTESITSVKIAILDLSPVSIIAQTPITQANFTSSTYYTVAITDGANYGEVLRIDLDRTCDAYGTKRLHFLSSIGAIDAFSFTKNNEQSRDITHFGMEKQWGGFNASNEFVFDNTQGREVDYLTGSSGKLTISTDWLPELVQNWLARELYESPYILMEIQDGTLLKRVKCANNQSLVKKNVNGVLFQEICQLNTSDGRKSMVI